MEKELSNNIVDLEAAWHIVREFKEPAVAIIKHTNPCGVAIADSLSAAYKKAYEADQVSAFGSIILDVTKWLIWIRLRLWLNFLLKQLLPLLFQMTRLNYYLKSHPFVWLNFLGL